MKRNYNEKQFKDKTNGNYDKREWDKHLSIPESDSWFQATGKNGWMGIDSLLHIDNPSSKFEKFWI